MRLYLIRRWRIIVLWRRKYTFTATNQAAAIHYGGSGLITYEYDTSDQRYQQAASDGTTVYWNAAGVTAEQFTAAGVTTWRSYIVADGQTVATVVGANGGAPLWGTPTPTWNAFNWGAGSTAIQYLHSDHLGSIIAVTDSSATVNERAAYDAWGKRRFTNGSDDTADTITSLAKRGYTDQEHVAEVALVNLNARMYDPQIGKFLGSDPLVAQPYRSQAWNRSAYVGNNPLSRTDPTGMEGTDANTCELGCNLPNVDLNALQQIIVTSDPCHGNPNCGLIDPNALSQIQIPTLPTITGGSGLSDLQQIVVTGKKKTTFPLPLTTSLNTPPINFLAGVPPIAFGPQSKACPNGPPPYVRWRLFGNAVCHGRRLRWS